MKKPTNNVTIKDSPSEEYDYEGFMVRTQLRRMSAQAEELLGIIKSDTQFPSWMQSKITLASEYMDTFYDYYKYSDESCSESEMEENDIEQEDDTEQEDDNTEAESTDETDLSESTYQSMPLAYLIDSEEEDDDMLPPSARMMKEQKNANKKG